MRFVVSFLFFFFIGLNLLGQTDSIPTQKIDEVSVVGVFQPSVSRSTSPVYLMLMEDLSRIGIQSLSDAVRRFPGVVVKDFGGVGGFKSVSLRGIGAEHTGVLYDGVPVSNAQSGQIDISRYSLDNVSVLSLTIGQSDDILRSAKTYASVGVLDIQTSRPEFIGAKHQAQLQLKTGSWGYFSPHLYYAQKLSDKFSVSIDGDWLRSDGQYRFTRKNGELTEKGKRKNTDVNVYRTEINLFGQLTDKQSLDAKVYYYDSERGLPGPIILYNPDKWKQRQWDKDFFSQIKYSNKLSEKLDFQAKAKYSYSDAKFVDEYISNNNSRYKQSEAYASGVGMYKSTDEFSVSLAEDLLFNTLSEHKYLMLKPERYTSLTALSAKYQHNNITLIGSLLGTLAWGEKNTRYAKSHLSPTFSVSYKPFKSSDLRVRASYKDIFRMPTFSELYYKQMGNIGLQSEKTQQYNLGLTWSTHFSNFFNYFRITGDVYYNNVRDKIVTYVSLPWSTVRNSGKVDIKGVDIDIDSRFTLTKKLNIRLAGNYTYQKALDMTSKDQSSVEWKNYKHQLPFTPLHSGTASLSFENPWINLSYSVIASAKTSDAPQNIQQNKIDAYTEHSVSLNRSFLVGKCKLRLQGEIVNQTDKTYYIIKDYPMPGRAFRLSMNIKF